MIKRRLGFISDERFLDHKTGYGFPECPERISYVLDDLKKFKLYDDLLFFPPIEDENIILPIIEKLYSNSYIQEFRDSCQKLLGKNNGYHLGNGDLPISAQSYEVALLAVGAAIRAIDSLYSGQCDHCFGLLRPPGHHASGKLPMGFCFFNNVALAAIWAKAKYMVKKVLIFDWDVHHGNGTQDIFYESADVFYISIHRYGGGFYPGTGGAEERGRGEGEGFTLNLPMEVGSNDQAYIHLLENIFIPAALEFDPELIIISAGFDAHIDDPLGGMSLTTNAFREMTKMIQDISWQGKSQGKIISLLEGGYDLSALADSVKAHLSQLMN